MLLPVNKDLPRTNIHYQILTDLLDVPIAQPTLFLHEVLNTPVLLPNHPQRPEHALPLATHHPLRRRPVVLQRVLQDQVRDELLLALLQAEVRQGVLVRDGLVRHAAEGEDQGADDARAVLAGRAVGEERGGRGRRGRGEVAEDDGEGLGAAGGRAGFEDPGVDLDEALEGGLGC